jgi:hypothetical protein
MKCKRSTLLLACVIGLLAPGPIRADEPPQREYIYGAELMSPAERERYRKDFAGAKGAEAQDRVRGQHRERMQQRARARGVTLDAQGVVTGQRPKQ